MFWPMAFKRAKSKPGSCAEIRPTKNDTPSCPARWASGELEFESATMSKRHFASSADGAAGCALATEATAAVAQSVTINRRKAVSLTEGASHLRPRASRRGRSKKGLAGLGLTGCRAGPPWAGRWRAAATQVGSATERGGDRGMQNYRRPAPAERPSARTLSRRDKPRCVPATRPSVAEGPWRQAVDPRAHRRTSTGM
jgi:hypothetical protein